MQIFSIIFLVTYKNHSCCSGLGSKPGGGNILNLSLVWSLGHDIIRVVGTVSKPSCSSRGALGERLRGRINLSHKWEGYQGTSEVALLLVPEHC